MRSRPGATTTVVSDCAKVYDYLTALIRATLRPAATNQTMYAWERYISQQVPVIWQPDVAGPILEVARNLRGVTPLNTFLGINPENWYYAK